MNQLPSAAAPRSRALETVLLVLSALGIAISVYLVLVHAGVTGGACKISETMDCGKVAASDWSTALGVPLAAWGVLAYAAVGVLALVARRESRAPGFGAGLLLLIAGAMTLAAVGLAYVSEVIIGSLCVFCAASWLTSIAILVVSLRLARRAGGASAAVRADVSGLSARPARAAGAVLAVLALAGGLVAAYRARPAVTAAGLDGPVTVLEFSDYLCPHCARMHVEEKAVKAANPQLRVERRHFPLDQACNPLVKRAFHDGSCELAKAGLCAEDQGKFDAFDDALFANQAAKLPLDQVAAQAGVDVDALRTCMDSPATADRLRADIQQGMTLGIRGTPSYVHDGKVAQGGLKELVDGLGAGTKK
jgi:protein-disulfide isomerase